MMVPCEAEPQAHVTIFSDPWLLFFESFASYVNVHLSWQATLLIADRLYGFCVVCDPLALFMLDMKSETFHVLVFLWRIFEHGVVVVFLLPLTIWPMKTRGCLKVAGDLPPYVFFSLNCILRTLSQKTC